MASLYPDKKFLLERIMCYLEKIFSFPEDDIADFSDTLFIFPSSEAGRLFREKAAVFFKSHGGVTELHTLLPEQLLFNPSYTEINPMQSINLWLDVLKKNAADSQFSLLSSGEDSTDEVLLPLAEYFSKVRENILLESGADSIDFTASLPDSILKNKLKEYLALEKIYRSKLNGHRDKAQVIADAALPDEAKIKNIILIECSELKNGICKFLERSSGAINVVHCLNIAENELEHFDNYGRPLTEKMIRVNPDFSLTSSFRSYSNPIAEAIKIASLLDKENLPSSIGVLDSELASSLTHMLEAKNIEVYAPQKKPLNSFYWCNLFNRMLKLRNRNIAFEDIFFWAQDDSFTNYAALDSTAVRREIELLQREHLLCNFESLAFFCRKYAQNPNTEQQYAASLQFCRALEQLAAKVRSIDESTLPEGLWETFAETASFNTLEFMDINSAENTLETLKNIIVQLRKIDEPSDRMLLFKYMCKTTNIANAEQFKDEALNLSGFLDLIWYENKSLIIGGISEEAFAGTAPEDMLFPENIRRQLNWSSADSRFGADIHRFNQLVKQYSSDEIFITFASANKSGSLYTLPRLLFTGSDTVLLEHCRLLFNKVFCFNIFWSINICSCIFVNNILIHNIKRIC